VIVYIDPITHFKSFLSHLFILN